MSASAIVSLLGTCPGLDLLEQELSVQLAGISRIIEVAGNAVLCRQGSPPDALRYLLEGQVALIQAGAGGENALIDVVHPVSSLALASVVAGEPHIMTAQATRSSRLLEIPAEPLRAMVQTRPNLAISMLRGVSGDVEAATRQVLDLKLRNSAQRLGCYLLSLAGNAPPPVHLRLPYQKRMLAARLGCRYENLSRAFAILRAFGVETHGARVILHDPAALHAFAGADMPMQAAPLPSVAEAFSRAFEL